MEINEIKQYLNGLWSKTIAPSLSFLGDKQTKEIVKAIENKEYEVISPKDISQPITEKLDEVSQAVRDIKIPAMPEIPMMPEKMKMEMEGVSLVAIKGEKGEKGETGERGSDGRDADESKIIKKVSKQIPIPKDGKDGIAGYTPIKGLDYFDGEIGAKPDHKWLGTTLGFENPKGKFNDFIDLKGEKGDKPDHEWYETYLRFEKPKGWGEWVDLAPTIKKATKTFVASKFASSGVGDFKADGSVPMTGNLTVGSETAGKNILATATLGAELAPALTGATTENWTFASPPYATPLAGTIVKDTDGVTTITPTAATNIVTGTTYKVVIVVDEVTAASGFSYTLGGVSGTSITAAGTYTEYIKAGSTGKLIITPVTTTTRWRISSISIKEITAGTGDMTALGDMHIGGRLVNPGGTVGLQIAPNGAATFGGALAITGALTGATTGAFSQTITQSTASLTGASRTVGLSLLSSTASTDVAPVRNSPMSSMTGRVWEPATTGQVTQNGSFLVSGKELTAQDVAFSSDGFQMFILGDTGNDITQYTLGTAWDVSTAVYVTEFSVSSQEPLPYGFYFRSDGLKLYVVGGTAPDSVYQYTLGTAWTISTASYDSVSFSVTAQETTPNSVYFRPDGKQMYVTGSGFDDIYIYNLSTAWDLTSASYSSTFVMATDTAPMGLEFSSDGRKMYFAGSTGDDINEYILGTPWDVTTAVYRTVYSIATEELTQTGIAFKPDGTKFFIVGSTSDTVWAYDLAIPWVLDTVASDTLTAFYSQVMPSNTFPATARLENGYIYGTSGAYQPYWNYLSNGKTGFGTTNPLAKFTVLENSSDSPRGILSMQISNDTNGARVGFSKARGVGETPSAILTGDTLGRLMFRGYDGANYLEMASIEVGSSGTVATNRVPTYMAFSTATNAAPSVLTERMRIDNAGNVGIGTTTTDSTAVKVLSIANGTAPTAHVDNQIQAYSVDSSDATATLGLMLEQQVEDIGTFTESHKIKIKINGTEYWISLDAV
jgi:sugar lactone lactonase YvrE